MPGLTKNFSEFANILAGPLGQALTATLAAITPIIDAMTKLLGFISKALSGLAKLGGGKGGGGGVLGAAKSLLGFNAAGTSNWRGGPTVVGEDGPEVIDVPQGARITPHSQLAD